jgi:hypothetical protein
MKFYKIKKSKLIFFSWSNTKFNGKERVKKKRKGRGAR